ncbi:BrxA/BrxB family bacilliredoxin [Streptomyces europaeiscabiei]|uniref:BrxA/BrxB family bacilliredoxin n=1 Tax=Streptomyces europaeiscabiei TaxID=146819 RepID=UPI002E17E2EE
MCPRTELLSDQDVDRAMEEAGTGLTLVAINSIHGMSAGVARPAARLALEDGSRRPDRLVTVFAEQDLEAIARMRSYFGDPPASEPSFALFKDGEPVHFVPRHRIEGRDAGSVAADLKAAFDEFGSP